MDELFKLDSLILFLQIQIDEKNCPSYIQEGYSKAKALISFGVKVEKNKNRKI